MVTVTWDAYIHVAVQEGRLGEAYGEEVAAVGGVVAQDAAL
jgi:hypothetical protein